ncbi:hypothetical protein [Streptomyces zaomyceticus]|uniref:hypothetical protein n=1 Tax=Streptomyces zaomyceticus TaxID=68286 RepID=UPI003413744C
MTARTLRPRVAIAAATLAFGGLALVGAPSAFAAPGDSGDVKAHSAGTPSGSQRDEAKVALAGPPPMDGNGGGGNGTDGNGPGPNGRAPNGQAPYGQGGNGQGAAGSDGSRGDPGGGRGESSGRNGGGGDDWNDGQGDGPPRGAVGAGGGGSAVAAAEDSSAFGVGAAVAAGLAGTVGLVLIRRSRRRDDGAA